MKISLLVVGKLKETAYKLLVDEYVKRLSTYAQVVIEEVTDEKTPDNASFKQQEAIKEKEGDKLLGKIKDDDFVALFDIKGTSFDSISFAKWLETAAEKSGAHITFIIGGSLGVSDKLKRRANTTISFSALTFTHQMMRVIVLEQIYRAYRINNNQPYHK